MTRNAEDGRSMLHRLRSEMIGLDTEVPVLSGGTRRYISLDNASSTPTFRPVMENMQRQENTPVEWRTVVVAPDIAYTVRINDVAQTDIAGNPGVEGRYAETILWVKRNGQWRVLTGHGSSPNDAM